MSTVHVFSVLAFPKSHIFRERILGTTSIAQRHAYRLMLAPAYIGVAFYFIGGALGLADMWGCGSSKESRLVVHIAVSKILPRAHTHMHIQL